MPTCLDVRHPKADIGRMEITDLATLELCEAIKVIMLWDLTTAFKVSPFSVGTYVHITYMLCP